MRNALPTDDPPIRDENDAASEDYPAISLLGTNRLHVFRDSDGEWCVWLNTETADFDGLCVSVGSTRDEAIADAVRVFEAAVEKLQEPPEGL